MYLGTSTGVGHRIRMLSATPLDRPDSDAGPPETGRGNFIYTSLLTHPHKAFTLYSLSPSLSSLNGICHIDTSRWDRISTSVATIFR